MKKKIISVLSLTILFISSAAQLTSFKEFTETRKDYLHEFIKPGPGLYAVLDYAGPHGVFSSDRNTAKAQYTIYDENLNIRHSAIVEGLKYNNFLGILEGAGSAQVFFEKKNQVFVADLNLETGQFKVPPIGVYKVNSNSDYFYKGYSADSAYGFAISSYTVSRKKHQIFDGVIFDKEMKTIRPFTYKLENPGKQRPHTSITFLKVRLEALSGMLQRKGSALQDFCPKQIMKNTNTSFQEISI
ncbi:hypothetical protein [Pseudobacter ginsenosidimutans]|uniref:WG repeat protein n=1 Tax=Pseudobacter ginsenosidimutans TaxID=661488 RepID=A0A4Q7MTK0_9BACT|nr:hypothetical protein [Pseudobacter ginsenosidimutans]QEC41900.1 hypothetical protein FSB84_09455 [Pseudobacter ginsenosidimutans]RZS71274.1 hypothetical protein EV199_3176 [Pseudobacter ginsenosidimutans]